ncbi:hypothetical protein IWW50_000498 [Coemansia erecta]|nr:hypothetical protein IWW50_000498 [Coemansia erecta]
MQNDDKSTQTSGQENVGAMLMQFLKLQQERDIAFSAKLDDLVQRLEAIALQSEHNCGSAVHCEFDKSPPTQSNNPDGTNFNTKTPISINLPLKTIKFNATFYRRLAREWNSKRVTMEELFKYMGNGLSAAYDAISAKACADIAARTHDFCVRNGLGRLETEDQRQTATNHLFQLIEKHLVPLRADSLPKLYWEDRHVTPMQNLRKPDGILLAGVRGLETRWSSVVAPIELKSSAYGHEDNHLRGQLIQDFRDMSEHQPRRFILGLAGAGQEMCEVRVYLHMSLGLFYSTVGILPSSGEVSNKHKNFVRFVLMLYEMLPRDSGFQLQKDTSLLSGNASCNAEATGAVHSPSAELGSSCEPKPEPESPLSVSI